MLTVVIVKVVGDIGRIGIILMCVIKESYPVYVQEKAVDSGKKAFEIIKMLNDKNLVNLKTVKDFIEIMDCLIKIL